MAIKTVTSRTVPVLADDDHLVFDSAPAVGVDTDVDQNAFDLRRVTVPGGWPHNIASAANPLRFSVSNVSVVSPAVFSYKATAGTCYYHPGAAGCDNFVNAGSGHSYLIGGTVVNYHSVSGSTTIGANAAATNIYIEAGSVNVPDDTSTDPTLIDAAGGMLRMERGATTMRLTGGTHTIDAGSNTIGTLDIRGADVSIESCGTITTLNYTSGRLRVDSLQGLLAVTTLNINMAAPDARALIDSGLLSATTIVKFCDAAA